MEELSEERSGNRRVLPFWGGFLPLAYFFDLQGDEAVVDVDLAADIHHFGDVLVVQPEDLLAAFFDVSVVQGDFNHVALLQLHLSCTALSKDCVRRWFFVCIFFFLTSISNLCPGGDELV